jgi:lipopolysaccharide/colanic/teichoic acid biosynthesis glycosyltransferase
VEDQSHPGGEWEDPDAIDKGEEAVMLSRPITSDFNARRLPLRRTVQSMLTTEQMNIAVQRESARADRSGGEFALVLFRIRNRDRRSLSTMRLAKTLLKRIRATDDIGWYDEDHLGVLLPDTSALGAWRFADAVSGIATNPSPRPLVTVYCYPTKWFTEDQAPASPLVRSEAKDRNGDSRGATKLIPYFLDGVRAGLAEQPPSAVHRLESLLVRPLPWWKRAIDVIGATTGIVLTSPLMAAAALSIKLTSRGPVVFKQQRAGLGGKPFTIYKLRTMVPDAEARKAELIAKNEQDGAAFKIKDDPRVTRVGKFLRKSSIDELPQLFNVLKGDMTLVGPRPLPVNEADACEGWQRRRLDVTPGLTCIWQVKGRSRVSFAEWVRMDVAYIRRRTLWHDLVILAQTIPAVLVRRGAR